MESDAKDFHRLYCLMSIYLEPETFIDLRLFQFDDLESLHENSHQTSILKLVVETIVFHAKILNHPIDSEPFIDGWRIRFQGGIGWVGISSLPLKDMEKINVGAEWDKLDLNVSCRNC